MIFQTSVIEILSYIIYIVEILLNRYRNVLKVKVSFEHFQNILKIPPQSESRQNLQVAVMSTWLEIRHLLLPANDRGPETCR